ncbi:MAG TPA: alpha/beta hydrolase [Burkholderiaceae bacterium]
MNFELDGQSAYAYTGGKPFDPALPGVVFVHGALHDHSVWGLQSRYLAHHGRAVLAVDLPGHGRSGGTALDVPAAGRWLVSLIEASGLSRTALVGHSMGSLIALEAAALLGARAGAVVMIGTAYPMKVSPKLLELCQRDVLAAIDLVNALSNSTHAAKPSNPGPGFSTHGINRALMRRMHAAYTQGHLFHADFAACDAYAGLESATPKLKAPVSLVLGARDQMTLPKAAAPIIEALKPSVTTLPVGHNLMSEDPDGVLNAIQAALKQEAR